MKFYYPIDEGDPENDALHDLLPEPFTFAAKIFFPFFRMPEGFKSNESASPHAYYPIDRHIVTYGTPVSWLELKDRCGFTTMAEMSKAASAWMSMCMGIEIYNRPDLQKRLERSLGPDEYTPFEDKIPLLIMKDILYVLSSNGSEYIKYGNVYEENGQFRIEEIQNEIPEILCSTPVTLTDEKEEFVFTCYFDEWELVFFSKKDARHVLAETNLEGVILSEGTPLVWENGSYEAFGS
ncbi:DUF2711 domain-containing protein [Halobacillus litoralis]|uniref:DUF2711 family protein n=1 Tax=Halobacillus litoralis TaxID=45668 RepID=UPI001CD58275|nr:DUF2711 family protein [Halobacillus litoralis]MCA0969313.1 DUF2711 domain-containing protein [Halobacillus litoralis]